MRRVEPSQIQQLLVPQFDPAARAAASQRLGKGLAASPGAAVGKLVFDPDTAEQDVDVLLRIHRELGGSLALNCEVLRPGRIRVGDAVDVRAPR